MAAMMGVKEAYSRDLKNIILQGDSQKVIAALLHPQ